MGTTGHWVAWHGATCSCVELLSGLTATARLPIPGFSLWKGNQKKTPRLNWFRILGTRPNVAVDTCV